MALISEAQGAHLLDNNIEFKETIHIILIYQAETVIKDKGFYFLFVMFAVRKLN